MKQLLWLMGMILISCSSPEERIYKNARQESDQGHFRISINYFDQVMQRAPESELAVLAAREAAKISLFELKDYKKAQKYYKFLILHSKDSQERSKAQQSIAQIAFENLQDYDEAIKEFSKIIQVDPEGLQTAKVRLSLARAYYYKNEFEQGEKEINFLLDKKIEDTTRFQALMLLGNTYLARKEYSKAIPLFKAVVAQFPQLAIKENAHINLAVCFEEMKDFKGAMTVLEQIENTYVPKEYIQLRIKKLAERIKNAPGARGLGKK